MSITKAEKETIILFDEADASAEVYTHNTKLKNRLARAANKHPQTYVLKYQNSDGGVSYAFPKKYLTVMFREPISDTDRERCKANCRNVKPSQYRRENSTQERESGANRAIPLPREKPP